MTQFPVEDGLRITRFDAPIRGIDRDGRFITYSAIPNPYPGIVPSHLQRPVESDSVLLIRANLWRPGLDTLARVRGRFRGRGETVRRMGSLEVVYELVNPLGVEEQAWMFPDGWIAVALASPYRVDWLRPDGRWVRGEPLPYKSIAVSDAEKAAALERYGPGVPDPPVKPSDFPGWPELVPPFHNEALLPMTDGRLAIARTITRSSISQVYDIVNRAGKLTARLEVPLSARIVAFGRTSVYLATRDEFDLEHLTRHPLTKF